MIRHTRFLISRRPYAVDLASLTGALDISGAAPVYRGTINAVWFRRIKGRPTACIGQLWDFQQGEPAGAAEFLARLTDGRSGGRCHGRWNGVGYWGDEEHYKNREAHLEILRPALDDYAATPAGYDGWWQF